MTTAIRTTAMQPRFYPKLLLSTA